jgi:putative flippase GtrA
MMIQFIKFGAVGAIGFILDTLSVYGLRGLIGLYLAGLLAYVIAASGTWIMNRLWTFQGLGTGSAARQWVKFMTANLAGFLLNRGTFFCLIVASPIIAERPVIAVAAGSIAGMFVNFGLSRSIVFR